MSNQKQIAYEAWLAEEISKSKKLKTEAHKASKNSRSKRASLPDYGAVVPDSLLNFTL